MRSLDQAQTPDPGPTIPLGDRGYSSHLGKGLTESGSTSGQSLVPTEVVGMETLRKRKPVLGEEDGVAILTNRGEGEYGGGKGSQDKRQAGNRGLQTLRCSQTAALGSRNSFWTSCIFSFQCLWSVDLSLST